MNILTDIVSLLRRKKYVDTVKPDDVLVLGIHEEPEILGVASPIPYKNVKLVKIKDLVINAQGCIHLNVPDPSSFAGIYKNTTTVDGQCYVNLRRLKSLSLNLTIVENGDFIEIDTTPECCSLEDTLLIGQITGGRDIITSDDDVIKAATGDAVLNLRLAPDTWFLGNLTSPTTTNSFIIGSTSALNIGMDAAQQFGLEVKPTSATLGRYDTAAPASFFRLQPSSAIITYESDLITPQDTIDGVIVSVESSVQDRNGSSENEGIALFLNSGTTAQPTKFNANTVRSVALGGKELTVNTDDTAYANQISLQQAGNALNTFIVPSAVTVSDKTATIQDKSGTIAYLSDIPTGTAINNIYNVNGVLTSPRSLDGFDGVTNHQLAFANLASFVIGATPTVSIATTSSISLTSSQIGIGGATSVSIATPNTIATLGKVGQVLKLNTTIGGCDWEDKYFAVDLNSTLPNVSVLVVGSNTTFTVTHNLDSLDVKPEVFKTSNGQTTYARIRRISVNEVTVRLKGTIANGDYRIII